MLSLAKEEVYLKRAFSRIKYKKRKIEALARLERSKNQLERSFDILSELENN